MNIETEEGSFNRLNPTNSTHLKTGLEAVGKLYLNGPEWIGKFAQKQYTHQDGNDNRSKTGRSIMDQLKKVNINVANCGLCMLDKPKSEFYHLAKCSHEYCYSCLNSYAISKIEDLSIVVCPHQECGDIMPLSSHIYKFLPDIVKIKYLQNKNSFKVDKAKE